MAGLARRITTTTTTTSSAASSRFIGGEDEGLMERIGGDDGGGAMVFRGGGAAGAMPVRSLLYESTGTADEGDTEDLMEPDLSDTSHMKFVDGRCSCCPYGYHVDLDFLQYLDSANNGEYLNSLKKIHHNKLQLRKSMESYLEQQELARRGNPSGSLPRNVPSTGGEQYTENFMSTVEKENRAATRVLDEIDKTIEGHLSTLDHSASVPAVKTRRVLTDGTNRSSDVTYDKTYTETIELRKIRHQRNQEFDSGSSLSVSSGPSSPTLPYSSVPGTERGAPSGLVSRPVHETTVTSTSSSVPAKQRRLLELEQQLLEIKPIPPTDQFQRTYINSAEFASSMAGLLPSDHEQDRATPTNERVNGVGRPRQSSSPEMTRISAATLQAIREQMAASLQRMHELEEQVKAIPVLQVRNSVLKEEKRMLELQMQSKADRLRSIGVGDYSVDESDFDERSELSYRRSVPSGVEVDRLRMAGLRREGEGTDDDGTFRSTTTVSLGYGVDGDLIPVRVHEKELKTEENTEIHEKEVKTVFLGGGGDDLTMDLGGDRRGREAKVVGRVAKKDVRSIGVGEGNVFDATGGVEVHQKELRTVYIGDAGKESKATRNVGILCKPAMRDVGMVHMTDSERPMQRTIAVGVGEVGVGESGGGYYVDEDGVEGGTSQSMNMAMSQMTISAYQSRYAGLRNDQLRSVLDEMLKRTVHSVAIQCSFSTEDKSVDASRVGYDMVDVACSDDITDVEVVPIRQMKSVAIDNRPSLFHRSCGTDTVYKIDIATNTQTQGIHAHRATNTEKTVTFPAATNTDSPVNVSQAVETEKAIFYALEQVHNMGTNTNIQQFSSVGLNTDLMGDVQQLVIKPEQKESSINTTTSSVRVWDKTTNTTPSQRAEKAVNTSTVPQFDRGINTEKPRVAYAAVNTDRNVVVSRGIECNIIQPEKKTSEKEEGLVQRSSEVTRLTGQEPARLTERQEVTEERPRLEEGVTVGSSGGRTTTTRVVKTVTRGGRSEISEDLPVAELGFRGSGIERDSGISKRTGTTTVERPEFEEGLRSGGRGSTTRTVTMVTRGGRSDVTGDFPAGDLSFQSLGREQAADMEGSSSRRVITTRSERPDFAEGFGLGSSGGRSSTTRTVTTVTRGGRSSGLTEDFPSGEVSFRTAGKEGGGGLVESSRRVITSRIERPEFEEEVSTGSSGGSSTVTRTIRTVTKGGGGKLEVEDFPAGEIGFRDDKDQRLASPDVEGDGSQRSVSTRTIKKSYRTGGESQQDSFGNLDLISGSGSLRRTIISGDESQLLSKLEGDFSRLGSGGQGGYSSSRTVIKGVSGDRSDPESWHEETWVSGDNGEESTSSRQMTGFSSSQTAGLEFPEQGSMMSETRIERHVTGKSSSSSLSSGVTSEEPLRSIMKSSRSSDRSSDQALSSSTGRKGISFSETATSKYEASEEIASACNVYSKWLQDSTCVSSQQLNSSLTTMQKEWFNVSSHKASSVTHVESYLKMIQKVSSDLLPKIINMADANGNTALHYAISNGNLDVVSLLLEAGECDINRQNKTGCTAIMMAALTHVKTERHREVIRQLFQTGDVNIQAPSGENIELAGQTALMLAVSHGRLDMVKLLLDCGANVNLQDEDGSTALMVAAEHGHVDITRLLLTQADCDALIADKDGSTAMSIAKEEGRQSIISLLNAHLKSKTGAQTSSQHKARKTVARITLSSPTEMS